MEEQDSGRTIIRLSSGWMAFRDIEEEVERLARMFVNGHQREVAKKIANSADPAELAIEVVNQIGQLDTGLRLARCVIDQLHEIAVRCGRSE